MGFASPQRWAQHSRFLTGPVHDKLHCQFLMLLLAAKFCPSVWFQASLLAELLQCVHRSQPTILPWKEQNSHLLTLERKLAVCDRPQILLSYQGKKKSRYLVPHALLFQHMPPFSGFSQTEHLKNKDNPGLSYPAGPPASLSRILAWHSGNGPGLSLPTTCTHTENHPSPLIPHFPFHGIPIFAVTN